MNRPDRLDADACYRALGSNHARFDGQFFTAVTSTGIYCRPVCRVRTPRRENCRFFAHAAQAERAGFRPCLRCRPELAPMERHWSTEDASAILLQQATLWLDEPLHWQDMNGKLGQRLAARLGVSERHLRRVFQERLGVSPLQYLLTRKLLTAKQLLADTDLPITPIAGASGFASVRRFNAAFLAQYRLNPTQLRRQGRPRDGGQGTVVRLGYRPPYDAGAMLAFLRQRQIEGVAFVDGQRRLGQTLRMEIGKHSHRGWLLAEFDETRCQLVLRVSDALREVLPQVIHRLRAAFDLDADPSEINAVLHGAFPAGDGLRVPGALDGFELAVRAVLGDCRDWGVDSENRPQRGQFSPDLQPHSPAMGQEASEKWTAAADLQPALPKSDRLPGQQITVAAARTLAQRLVNRFGEPIATPFAALSRLFPAPEVLAQASGDALGALGIVKQRQTAIVALARGVAKQGLVLNGSANVTATLVALKALPGIGDWTAQYIAMRALRWPDAFPAGDVALHKALGIQGFKHPAREAEAASQAWRPWRSYAVVRAWSAGRASPTGTSA